MFNRFSKVFFTVISAVTHFCMLCLIISIPIFLIWQGEKDPDFAVYSVSVESAVGDSTLASKGISGDGWYRIDYSCGATSGRFSPYTYYVEYIEPIAPKTVVKSGNFIIAENGPFEFPGGEYTQFSLTLYVEATEAQAQEIADTAGFGTRNVSKGFSMIEKDIDFIMPGFYVADCRSDAPIGG